LAVASTKQLLYERNFAENKWKAVGERKCHVQVAEKNGEFYFRITDGKEVNIFREDMQWG
jgi:hypothetical protein